MRQTEGRRQDCAYRVAHFHKHSQRLTSSKRKSQGEKKLALQEDAVHEQGRENLGLHPRLGRVVIALGNVARREQTLEPLEHQFDLPPPR